MNAHNDDHHWVCSDSKTCLECLQQFAELSPSEYGKGQCPRCEIQRKRSSSTAVQAPIVLESADDYDLWIEQDKLAKLQWPKVLDTPTVARGALVR
jgi:hypothetical protein